jgi:hypothetical protein
MFERLSVRASKPLDSDAPLDLGVLVEGLLFYQQTEVNLTPGAIKQIAKVWSSDGLIALLESGVATFRFQQGTTAIRTENTGTNRERYSPVVFNVQRGSAVAGPDFLIGRVLEEVTGKRGRARRITDRVCRSLIVEQTDSDITTRVKSDLLDVQYVDAAMKKLTAVLVPDLVLPATTRFEVQEVEDGLRVLTNIDFAVANTIFQRIVPDGTFSPAYVLAHLFTAREMMEDAARCGADMLADRANSAVAALRIQTLIDRRTANENHLAEFQDLLFEDGRAIREAVNSGGVTYREVLQLVENAAKFKNWLQNQPPEQQLIKSYFRSVTESSWADKLPSKTMRWLLFSGIGAAVDMMGAGGLGTAGGALVGAVDTFFVDRLLRGWKPNHFIDKSVRPFLTNAQNRKCVECDRTEGN